MTKTLPIANRRLPIDFGGMARGRLSRSHAAGARPSPGAAINKRRTGAELAGRRPAIRTFIRQGAEDLRSFNPSGRVHVAAPGDGRAPAAFSLVELLLVMTLLSLIVFALMAVFNSTQKAFRASITQTDVLEGSRAAMELIASDLRGLTPSGGISNAPDSLPPDPHPYPPVNFFVVANSQTGYEPLPQSLPGGSAQRTNLLNTFFVLGRENTKWTGVGYVVDATNTTTLYPLYRFYAETNVIYSPWTLYNLFATEIANSQWTNMSHVIDGVVQLTVRAYDPQGRWINGNLSIPNYTNALNTRFLPPFPLIGGEAQFFMFSNMVPASVELNLGVMEDRTLDRAESIANATARWGYLTNQVGRVHLFRQRVTIPNVDPTAYQ
jgi:type II secretory pathway pseudopilin PulG